MPDTRAYWISTLVRIAHPVFAALAEERLRDTMPVEGENETGDRARYTHLEAVGRSLAGIAPWLNLTDDSREEGQLRVSLRELVRRGLDRGSDPQSRGFLNFSDGLQPIVDTAFLAQGLLRSWESVWLPLPDRVKGNLIAGMKATRTRKPPFNNWLLFSAMIEAFLCKAGTDWDPMRVDFALRQHEQWYAGDGMYGDGPRFHWDYYNSFVIQPMLYDIATSGGEVSEQCEFLRERMEKRLRRYAAVQERLIAPDGSFPPVGRSLAYRFGAFHALALAAWKSGLPEGLSPAGVRCALTSVIRRMVEAPGTFDEDGWLRIGFCGHQPSLGEGYISTGSLYLCLCGLLPLGLPPENPFWAAPDAAWTAKRIWNGEDAPCDHAMND